MDRTGTKKVDQETAQVVQIKKENRRSIPQAEIPGDQAPSTEAYPTSLLGICSLNVFIANTKQGVGPQVFPTLVTALPL